MRKIPEPALSRGLDRFLGHCGIALLRGVRRACIVMPQRHRVTSQKGRTAVYLSSALNRFVLDIAGMNTAAGTPVIAWPRNNPATRNQHWQVGNRPRSHIRSLLNGFVLDIAGANPAPGAPIIAWPRNNPVTLNQLWTLERQPDGRNLVVSALNGFVLDIAGANRAPGAAIIAWPRNTPVTPNQLWIVEQIID